MTAKRFKPSEIGEWSELKLKIIKKYAVAYSTILAKKKLRYYYIDGFAGAGRHVSKKTQQWVPGSPLNALEVVPPFNHYFFIDLKGDSVQSLRNLTRDRSDVSLFEGDCNEILLRDVFPKVRFEDFRRALCLLDPYGLHLKWSVIKCAAELRSVEIFLNFPTMDINRNALRSNQALVTPAKAERMTAFWGDDSWKEVAYRASDQGSLFNEQEFLKVSNDAVAGAFRDRLREVAGFKFVPKPIAMRNSTNSTVYYLFFASHNKVGNRIASDIFRNHDKSRSPDV